MTTTTPCLCPKFLPDGEGGYEKNLSDEHIEGECPLAKSVTPTPRVWEETFVEKGADIEHARWARRQKHLHSKLKYWEFDHSQGGSKVAMYVLDPAEYGRWSRQIDTPYSELSESEKESDRKESRNYLPLVQHQIEEAYKRGYKRGSSDAFLEAAAALRTL